MMTAGSDADPENDPVEGESRELPKSFWAEFGLPEPTFRSEETAPPVQRELLLRVARRELPERNARAVLRFVESYKSWNDAYLEVLVSEYHRTGGTESQSRGSPG